jgi:hypothetical protein
MHCLWNSVGRRFPTLCHALRAAMPDYSIVILICSSALSHSDCQPNTALDVVRGPQVNNPVMCALDAQTMLARTDLVQAGEAQYVKVVCTRSRNADQWKAEIEARKAAANPNQRPSSTGDETRFTYFADTEPIAESSSPNIKNRSHTITAFLDQPGDGVLVAAGGVMGGYALFVKDRMPTYEYNWLGRNRYRITSSEPLPTGRSVIRVKFKYDAGGPANGGNVAMFLDDKKVGEGRVEMTMSARWSSEEAFDVGLDTGSAVSDQYASPFWFTGEINRIEVAASPEE